jgi:hypothetical protein
MTPLSTRSRRLTALLPKSAILISREMQGTICASCSTRCDTINSVQPCVLQLMCVAAASSWFMTDHVPALAPQTGAYTLWVLVATPVAEIVNRHSMNVAGLSGAEQSGCSRSLQSRAADSPAGPV